MLGVVMARPEDGAFEVREDLPDPEPEQGQALVRVRAAAICGTDRHIIHWDPSIRGAVEPPRIIGHEFCGVLEAVGPDTDVPWEPGQYVSCEMHEVCGLCRACRTGDAHVCPQTRIYGLHRDGCFAERVVVPAANLIALDESFVPPRVGAFLDPLGNAVHTVEGLDLAGAGVAITGYGPIGAMAAAVCAHSGAADLFITDVRDTALERARAWADGLPERGRTRVHVYKTDSPETSADAVEAVRAETDGGADVSLEMSGAPPAINDSVRMVRNGGEVRLLGLPRDNDVHLEVYRDAVFRGITLRGIIGRRMYDTWYKMLSLLKAGLEVEHVVTTDTALADFADGFQAFDRGDAQKVVLWPGGAPDDPGGD